MATIDESRLQYRRLEPDGARRRQFDALYRHWRPVMYSSAFRALGNTGDAEDATQEAFTKAWIHFDRLDPGREFGPWISRILTNVMVDRYRTERVNRRMLLSAPYRRTVEEGLTVAPATQHEIDPHAHLVYSSLVATVQNAINRLPAKFQTIARLSIIQNLSYADVAARSGNPIGTVKSRLHRARHMLRRELLLLADDPRSRSNGLRRIDKETMSAL